MQGGANGLEAADEVEHLAPRVGAACGLAKVGAAGEGAISIYEAAARAGVKHGTGAVAGLWKPGPPRSTERPCRQEGLGVGQPGSLTRESELAALSSAEAIALDGPGGEISVYLAHAGNHGLRDAGGLSGGRPLFLGMTHRVAGEYCSSARRRAPAIPL